VPAQFFGIFMSVNPVLAALVGLVVLDQRLGRVEWFAIGVIVSANAIALSAGRRGTSQAGSSRRVRRSSRPAHRDGDPAVRKGCGDDGERRSPRAEE
jgi:inner membrane transporter RhtA